MSHRVELIRRLKLDAASSILRQISRPVAVAGVKTQRTATSTITSGSSSSTTILHPSSLRFSSSPALPTQSQLAAASSLTSSPYSHTPASLRRFSSQLVATMLKHSGVGLAAPQIDREQRIFAALFEDAGEEEGSTTTNSNNSAASSSSSFSSLLTSLSSTFTSPTPTVCVNPRLLWSSSRTLLDTEGCLSLPGLVGRVVRSATIEVEYYDPALERIVRRTLSTLNARIFLHELDHLNGQLLIDRCDENEIYTESAADRLKL